MYNELLRKVQTFSKKWPLFISVNYVLAVFLDTSKKLKNQ